MVASFLSHSTEMVNVASVGTINYSSFKSFIMRITEIFVDRPLNSCLNGVCVVNYRRGRSIMTTGLPTQTLGYISRGCDMSRYAFSGRSYMDDS